MSPLFVVGLMVCVLFCGLTTDIGRMELLKIQMQNASDAAAIGAELESERASPCCYSGFDWASQGMQDAALNGFNDGVNGATVTLVQAPSTGLYAGRYDAIEATITQTFSTIFMGALNGGSYTLTTKSVALVPPCNYFLGAYNASYSSSFANASAVLNATCPVYANYNFVVDGFSRAFGFGVDVSGTANNSGGGGWISQQSEYVGSPPQTTPTFNLPVLTDPLATTVTQPTFSSCNFTSKSITSGTVTLSPGTYCGTASTVGLTVQNANVTLNPGLYIITGGAACNGSTITGTGVTLFFTRGNGAGYGQFRTGDSSPCSLSLSAPVNTANGGITAILFFADRNWVATSGADFSLNTNGSFSGDGIWYLPYAGMFIWQNSWNVPNYGSFITRDIYFYNTGINLNGNYSWLTGGSPFRKTGVLVQ
jgi:Putative Flp pilus-assembly TadE/G-like